MPHQAMRLPPSVLCTALLLLSFCPLTWAVGVSDIQLQSKLGEPLRAQLLITNTGDLTSDQLIVRIPPKSVYDKLGVERSYDVLSMKFKIEADQTVTITTHDAIKEPYLHFVIEVVWPEGQLYREYKLFLDPA